MLANHQHSSALHPRTRLIIAGMVGVLIAVLAIWKIWLPTLGLLAQFSQFSPLERAAITIKLLSPLLSFFLASGWSWVLLLIGEWLVSSWGSKGGSSQSPSRLVQVEPTTQEPPTQATTLRAIAAPPLFQLDPAAPWQRANLPVTPLPLTNPAWPAHKEQEQDVPAETQRNEGEEEERGETSMTPAEQIIPSLVVDSSSPRQEEGAQSSARPGTPLGSFSLRKLGEPPQTQPPVTLTLLKQIRAWVRADDETTQEVRLRGGENAIRLIQLAYIAWRQGQHVDRDKMLTYVLLRGKRRDMNTEQLGEVFDAAKRYLRQDLDRAVKDLEANGHPVSGEIDLFSTEPGFYWLHPSCRVIDLEKIDQEYQTIQMARKEGLLDEKLDGSLPDWVVEACQKLIEAYPADFLQSLLEKFPEEFGAWVREPVTLYRDSYLEALLILANYESALGKNFHDGNLPSEQNEEQRRHHIARAAQLFYDYAMYALNTRWDHKLKFTYRAGKDGERVVRAARAIRRCVVELGKLGNPDMIDQVYYSFKERMGVLSEGNWKPDADTERDVVEAKRTTSAYRFSSQMPSYQDRDKN
jgi:hypothetical protein